MPTTEPGRILVKQFMKDQGIRVSDLAKLYGMTKQEISNYLNGQKTNPKSAQFVLTVIRDFKIKGENEDG